MLTVSVGQGKQIIAASFHPDRPMIVFKALDVYTVETSEYFWDWDDYEFTELIFFDRREALFYFHFMNGTLSEGGFL